MAVACLIALVAALMFGCGSSTGQPPTLERDITYHYDSRTGLCFARLNLWREGGIATVPCPSVHDWLETRPKGGTCER